MTRLLERFQKSRGAVPRACHWQTVRAYRLSNEPARYDAPMTIPDDLESDEARVRARAEALTSEEIAAGTDDAEAQAAAILEESDEREDDRVDPPGPAVEHRHSEDTVELPVDDQDSPKP
jgi:hypothetical protein